MNRFRRLGQSPLFAGFLISTFVFLATAGLRRAGSFESHELVAYDWSLRLLPETGQSGSAVVLVNIGEDDIRRRGWPLSDADLSKILKRLASYEPTAIGLDIYRDIPLGPGGDALQTVLQDHRNIIMPMKFGDNAGVGIPPPAFLAGTDQVGFNDILVDSGGIVRRALLYLDDGKTVFSSFALRLALLYLEPQGITPQPDPVDPQHLRLGPTTIPPLEADDGFYVNADMRGYQFLLDFNRMRKSFPSYSLSELLSGKADPAAFRNRVVLVGVTSTGVKDFFYTPYSRSFHADQQISGISLHAHILDQLVRFGLGRSTPIRTYGEWEGKFWIWLWCVLGVFMGHRVRSPWLFSLVASGGILILGLAAYFTILQGRWISLIPPAIAWVVSAAVFAAYMSNLERVQRALLMNLFARHVSPEIAEDIWRNRDQFMEGGRARSQKLVATVLFTDMKGFTALSEKMKPETLMRWLNDYQEAMARSVIEHGGVVDDYSGDGLKADFGVPLPRSTETEIARDAVHAVDCALTMEREMERLRINWEAQGLPKVAMRIGIFTGPVVAGPLGSAQRLKYTTIGDTVNIAARLESFDKEGTDPASSDGHCRILIGETTLRYLGPEYETRKVGEAVLKGRVEPTTIYRLVGRRDRPPRDRKEMKP